MTIRPYQGSDISGIISLWNAEMPADPITETQFVKCILLDLNFRPENLLVALDDNTVVGFVYTVIRRIPVDVGASLDEGRGWICAIAVRDGLRQIADPLLREAEAHLSRCGVKRITACGYTPNYFYQGINEIYSSYLGIFKENGYLEVEKSVSMKLDLKHYETPPGINDLRLKLESEGITFCDLSPEHIPSWLTFQKPSWTHRFRRLLNETGQFENITVALCHSNVIGCNIFGDPYSDVGRFGPFGVVDGFNGRGIGKVLLDMTMQKMKARGIPYAWMQWATAADYVVNLYLRFGFEIMNTYITFEKTLTEDTSNG